MKKILKRMLPPRAVRMIEEKRRKLRLKAEFLLDYALYHQFMTPEDGLARENMPQRNIETQLIKDYHRVEKGLALPSPKRPFGREVEDRLRQMIPVATANSEHEHNGRRALNALQNWNASGEIDEATSPVRGERFRGLPEPGSFFMSRHSVRDYSEQPVDDQVLRRAATLALASSSVCNRQPWRVMFLRGLEARRALSFQNGNRGFGDLAPVVAVVTVDARLFAGAGERNQAWIEGGIFAASLQWAFHALGVDSCMLNTSFTHDHGESAKRSLGLESSDLVIMMMSIGYGREGHRVARSPRRPLREVCEIRGGGEPDR